jgi:hypothetical protein
MRAFPLLEPFVVKTSVSDYASVAAPFRASAPRAPSRRALSPRSIKGRALDSCRRRWQRFGP